MADKRELILSVKGKDDGASRVLRNVGDAADDTEGNLRGMNKGLAALDSKIADTTKTLTGLRQEIGRTGDLDLIKDVTKQEQRLKALTRQRKSLIGADDGADSAVKFSAGFSQRIGPLLAKLPLSAPMQAAVGTAAGAAAPALALAIGGAITTGVSLGVVAAGIKIASKDPKVQAAGKDLGAELSAGLADSAKSFVPATLDAIDIIRDEFQSLRPELTKLFGDAAQYVEPLTRGLAGFARELLPGLREATANAKPLIDVLAAQGPKAAEAFSDAIGVLSQNAGQAAIVLDSLFNVLEFGITSTAVGIDLLGKMMPAQTVAIMDWLNGLGGTHHVLKDLKPATDDAAGGIKNLGDKAATAAVEVETFAAMIKRVTGENISAEQANIRLEEAIDRATAAAKENGDGIDANHPKQRANREALLGIAEAANQSYEAILTQTGSQEQAAAAAERGRRKFLETADAMGVEKGEAKRLADMLFGIPKDVKTKADLEKAAAERKIKGLLDWIDRIPSSKTITVNVRAGQRSGVGGLGGLPFSEGGLVEGPGTTTSDSVSARLSKGEYVLTARDVNAMGGPQAIDSLRRSLRRPAVSPASVSTTSGGTQTVRLIIEGTGVLKGLQKEIRIAGGVAEVFR